jgi:hypothetical protein
MCYRHWIMVKRIIFCNAALSLWDATFSVKILLLLKARNTLFSTSKVSSMLLLLGVQEYITQPGLPQEM